MKLTESIKQTLDEKLIILNKGEKFGQVLIASGGAASGKGYALQNFIDSSSYKTFDVDELKAQLIKLAKLKGDKEIANLNLREPSDVAKLHQIVKEKGLADKKMSALLSSASPERLPNLIFDKTGKSKKDFEDVVKLVTSYGYKPDNIHVIWVLTDYKVAYKGNLTRERIVPRDTFLQTHKGASTTMQEIVSGSIPKGVDGDIHVILNNRTETQPWTDSEGGVIINSKGGITPKSFTSIKIKDSGKSYEPNEKIQTKLADWIVKNVPKSTI